MKDERDHPCRGCRDFVGYRTIRTKYCKVYGVPQLDVEIPICGRIVNVLTIGRCKQYVPSEFQKLMMKKR